MGYIEGIFKKVLLAYLEGINEFYKTKLRNSRASKEFFTQQYLRVQIFLTVVSIKLFWHLLNMLVPSFYKYYFSLSLNSIESLTSEL